MANQFVAVPALVLEQFLQNLNFTRSVKMGQVVYTRSSRRNPDLHILVYTSIRPGQNQVRGAGQDSIRVCVVFDNGYKSFGVGKFQPIFRVVSVENVLNRLFERLHQAAKRANEWLAENERRYGVHPQAQPVLRRKVSEDESTRAWQDRLEEKAAFAEFEREQEAKAFLSDPDYQQFLASDQRRPTDSEIAEGFAAMESGPSETGLTFEEYKAHCLRGSNG